MARQGGYAAITVALVAVALAYSLAVNLLSMFESTMCLRFAGGDGMRGGAGGNRGRAALALNQSIFREARTRLAWTMRYLVRGMLPRPTLHFTLQIL